MEKLKIVREEKISILLLSLKSHKASFLSSVSCKPCYVPYFILTVPCTSRSYTCKPFALKCDI